MLVEINLRYTFRFQKKLYICHIKNIVAYTQSIRAQVGPLLLLIFKKKKLTINKI